VVRGAAAVLAPYGAALAYLLLAPSLPTIHGAQAAGIVAGALGALLLAACAIAAVPAGDSRVLLALALVGGFLIVGGLDAANAGAAAGMPEAFLYGLVGAAFAAALDTPALALALPLFAAVVDAATVFGGGPTALSQAAPSRGDPLTLDLPAWGGGSVGHLGIVDLVFLGAFAAYARRHGLRRGAAGAGMALGLAAAFAVQVAAGRAIPALPFVAAGMLLPNADRLGALFRRAAHG
jgi:hypothetical protein